MLMHLGLGWRGHKGVSSACWSTAQWPAVWTQDASHEQPTTDEKRGPGQSGGATRAVCDRAPPAGGGTGLACRSCRACRQPKSPSLRRGIAGRRRRGSQAELPFPSLCPKSLPGYRTEACYGQALSGRNMLHAKQIPSEHKPRRRRLNDQSQAGQVRQRCR